MNGHAPILIRIRRVVPAFVGIRKKCPGGGGGGVVWGWKAGDESLILAMDLCHLLCESIIRCRVPARPAVASSLHSSHSELTSKATLEELQR